MRIHSYQIKSIVEHYFSVNLNTRRRKRHIVDAKKIYCKLCTDLTGESLTKIARTINKHHATILHHSKTAAFLIQTDPVFAKDFLTLKRQIDEKLRWVMDVSIPVKPNYLIHPARFRKDGKSLREVLIKRGQTSKISYGVHKSSIS